MSAPRQHQYPDLDAVSEIALLLSLRIAKEARPQLMQWYEYRSLKKYPFWHCHRASVLPLFIPSELRLPCALVLKSLTWLRLAPTRAEDQSLCKKVKALVKILHAAILY